MTIKRCLLIIAIYFIRYSYIFVKLSILKYHEGKVWWYDKGNIKLYVVEGETDETMTNKDLKSLHKQIKIERHESSKIKPVVTSERRCSWKVNRSCNELQSIFACLFFPYTGDVLKSNRPNSQIHESRDRALCNWTVEIYGSVDTWYLRW